MSTCYKIRQKLFSIGDDFWIENQDGQKVFKVDGKALRLRKTLIFEDINGNKLCQIQERWLPIKETMEIEDPAWQTDGRGQEGAHHPAARQMGCQNQRWSRPGCAGRFSRP